MEFEHILLRNLFNPNLFSKVFHLLEPKYFATEATKDAYKIFKEYYTKFHEVPTLVDFVTAIRDVPDSEHRKNLAELTKQIKDIEQSTNVEFLAEETVKFIKDSLYLEALMLGSEGLQKKDDSLKLKAQSILDQRAAITLDESLGLSFSDVDEMISYFSSRNVGILSQHKELNKRLGTGFLPGTLSVICAAQGVGKSLLLCDLISGFIQSSKKVLLVSLEMSEHEMMRRVYANVFGIEANRFSDLSKTEGELADVIDPINAETIRTSFNAAQLSGKLGDLYVKEYPAGSFSALMLEDLVKKFKEQRDVEFDIILVDYLGIAKSDRVSPSVGLYSYIKAIGEEFRASAVKLQVPVISCSQLNRGAINHSENVDNANLADSIGTAMTADFILFLLSTEEMKASGQMVMKVTKNRFNGVTDQWLMDVDYPRMRFSDHLGVNDSTFNSVQHKEQVKNDVDDILKGLGLD